MPPVADTVAVPLQVPPQVTLVLVPVNTMGGGSVMVNCSVVSHPLASVMVRLHAPAQRPLTADVPSPAGFPGCQS